MLDALRISYAAGRLSDFSTGSASYVTERGSYIGMSSALEERGLSALARIARVRLAGK